MYRIFSFGSSQFLRKNGKILEFKSKGEANRFLMKHVVFSPKAKNKKPFAVIKIS